jgi:hypothetical protein
MLEAGAAMSDEALPGAPDASRGDLAELRERVGTLEDRLFILREVPTQTPFTIDVLFDRLEELAAGLDRFAYVVDLRGAKRPDAQTRERLRQRVLRINIRLAHVGVVVGTNAVIRAVAKLAAFAVGFRSFSFHESVNEATEACRRALR